MVDTDRIARDAPSPPPRRRGRGGKSVEVWAWVVGVCLATGTASYFMFVEPPPPRRIVIAGGGREGAYFAFANEYARELSKDGLAVEVRETAGSLENLRLLRDDDSGVSVAIVQSGTAGPDDADELRALGSLYREPLWVFHRADREVATLRGLAGMRIGIGAEGSGTRPVARRMLAANGLADAGGSAKDSPTRFVAREAGAAAEALRHGELDAAFFVAAFEAEYVQDLLNDPRTKLLDFKQQEAYRRRFRFLAPVTLPRGIVDLGEDLPPRDVALLAPAAMLVVRGDFHPALQSALLAAAYRIHGGGDVLNEPREFPSERYCDIPVSEDARRFHRSGRPWLQRILPFWLASLADRAKLMLIPVVMLMMPLFRAAPPLIRWRTRRKIYRWYGALRDVDQKLAAGPSGPELDRATARLRSIEHKVVWVDVPLSYMEEFYQLRMHLAMMMRRLDEFRGDGGRGESEAAES